MKGATQSARRLKQLFRMLRTKLGKVNRPAGGDPVTQLILGIFTRDAPESKAREALDRMRGMVVDYNELRVIPPLELAAIVGDFADVRTKCEDVTRALNRVFAMEHIVSLDRLTNMPRKDVRLLLDKIDGLEPYTRARIQLLGLQQHAIPLDQAMWAYARSLGVVDSHCSLAEAQLFLERQISEEDALEFVALLRKQAWNEIGALVRRGEVATIRSVPPDRTSRNMLQPIEPVFLPSEEDAQEAEASTRRASGAKARSAGSNGQSTAPAKGRTSTDRASQSGDRARGARSARETTGSAKRRKPNAKAKSA